MSDLGYAPARAARRAYEPDAALSDMAAFCGSDGFSVRGIPVPAEPLAADRKYGLEPAVDRETYERLPGVRLRGTTPDPLDEPGARPGRGSDILYRDADGEPVVFPVVSNFTEEQRKEATDAMLRRYLTEPGVILYDGPNGRLKAVPQSDRALMRVRSGDQRDPVYAGLPCRRISGDPSVKRAQVRRLRIAGQPLERRGRLHVMYRTCRGCGESFMKYRFATQRAKWGWVCSPECQKERKRRADRERMRRRRASRVSCRR